MLRLSSRDLFEDTGKAGDGPVWCFDRYGLSSTELSDGTYLQIGGEHEDSYDPDFCIFNEVVVNDDPGSFRILGFPREVFPPADFHTATCVGVSIWIIGRPGYPEDRQYGRTPVFRLDTKSWRIEEVRTTGECPGWIHEHKARLSARDSITVSGGVVLDSVGSVEIQTRDMDEFTLRLSDMTSRRTRVG